MKIIKNLFAFILIACFILNVLGCQATKTYVNTSQDATSVETTASIAQKVEAVTSTMENGTTENTTPSETQMDDTEDTQMKREKQVIVYFPNWNLESKSANEGGEVGSIVWESVSIVNHAFFAVCPEGDSTESSFVRKSNHLDARTEFRCVSTQPEYDFEDMTASAYNSSPRNHFSQYGISAKKYPNVKIMISVGGWTRSGFFSEMCYTKAGRTSFIQSLVDWMKQYDFIAGIDIDWEYPAGSGNGERLPEDDNDEGCPIWDTREKDNENFTLLLAQMRETFDREFGEGEKLITACASGSVDWTLKYQDWNAFEPYLDYINVMTYDLTGAWAGVTSHQSPLDLTQYAADYFLSKGIAPTKLNIGTPMYAMWFKMAGNSIPDSIVGATIDASATMTGDFGDMDALRALEEDTSGDWVSGFDEEAGAAYIYNANPSSPYYMWYATYESTRSLQLKLELIHSYDLAGMIVWESSLDTADHRMVRLMGDELLSK